MKKQMHELYMDHLKDAIPRSVEQFIDIQRQSDRVVTWQTAISTGALVLILAQSDNLNIANPFFLKSAVVSLLIGITSGAVYRAFVVPLEGLWRSNFSSFENYIAGYNSEEIGGVGELRDEDSIEDIARKMKEDFGVNHDEWLENDYLDREFWATMYTGWAELWEKQTTEGLESLNKEYAIMLNLDPATAPDLTDRSDSSINRGIIRRYQTICNVSHIFTLVFFVVAVISLGMGYVLTGAPAPTPISF